MLDDLLLILDWHSRNFRLWCIGCLAAKMSLKLSPGEVLPHFYPCIRAQVASLCLLSHLPKRFWAHIHMIRFAESLPNERHTVSSAKHWATVLLHYTDEVPGPLAHPVVLDPVHQPVMLFSSDACCLMLPDVFLGPVVEGLNVAHADLQPLVGVSCEVWFWWRNGCQLSPFILSIERSILIRWLYLAWDRIRIIL